MQWNNFTFSANHGRVGGVYYVGYTGSGFSNSGRLPISQFYESFFLNNTASLSGGNVDR